MPIATLRSSWGSVRSKGSSRSMVRPFEKPHGRLPRRPSVPSPSRNHHDRLDHPLVPSIELRTGSELVKGCAPFPALRRFKRSKFKDRLGWGTSTFREFSKRRNVKPGIRHESTARVRICGRGSPMRAAAAGSRLRRSCNCIDVTVHMGCWRARYLFVRFDLATLILLVLCQNSISSCWSQNLPISA